MASPPVRTSNDFITGLETLDQGALIQNFVPIYLDQHQVLDEPGSDVKTVYFPTGAILSVVTLMEDGQGVEVCTIGHEGAYGLTHALGSPASTDRVVVQVAGECLKMPAAVLRAAAAASPALTNLILRHVQANVAQTQQSVACNALHTLEERLCRWLLMSHDRTATGKLRLTQEYLSFMLGVQRTTVTRAARTLQSAGLIRYVRGQMEILDRGGLEQGSCECYAAVKHKLERLLGHPAS